MTGTPWGLYGVGVGRHPHRGTGAPASKPSRPPTLTWYVVYRHSKAGCEPLGEYIGQDADEAKAQALDGKPPLGEGEWLEARPKGTAKDGRHGD